DGVLDDLAALMIEVGAVEAEPVGERAGWLVERRGVDAAQHGHRGVAEHRTEEDVEPARVDEPREIRAGDGPRGRAELEEHGHADVRQALLHVRGRGAARRGDDGDDGGADGQADVDVEEEGEDGDDDQAAAEAEQRAEKAGHEGHDDDDADEEKRRHVAGATTRSRRAFSAMPTIKMMTLMSWAMVNGPRKRSSLARTISTRKRSMPISTRNAPKTRPRWCGRLESVRRMANITNAEADS